MEKENIKIAIIGTGISGLSIAWLLEKEGYKVEMYDKNPIAGGVTNTKYNNDFVMDFGPNSALETTPLIAEVAEAIGMKEEMVYPNEVADKRYILKNNELYPLPTKPNDFLKSKLFSGKAKLRLMMELFVGKSKDGYYQSIADFVKRRLGKEFLEYAIDPFVSGVFAGDPHRLSVKSAFPKLYRLEEKYGGIFKGVVLGMRERKKRKEKSKSHAKMFSFKRGMRSFPLKLADSLNAKIHHESLINKVEKADGKYIISTEDGKSSTADVVISTAGAYAAARFLGHLSSNVEQHLNAIYYPPVIVLYVNYKKADIKKALDGFGFLIPSLEKKTFLGAIWSSTLFENRAADDEAAFTIFIGGAKKPELLDGDADKLIEKVLGEFEEIMSITDKPTFKQHKHWKKAIPQYNLGHVEHDRAFEEFEKEYPGLFLAGNYRGGISFGDCFKNAEIVKDRAKSYIEKNYK